MITGETREVCRSWAGLKYLLMLKDDEAQALLYAAGEDEPQVALDA
jgi:hypothetical protein